MENLLFTLNFFIFTDTEICAWYKYPHRTNDGYGVLKE